MPPAPPDTAARSDRLYALIRILRDGRLHRATALAARMGVSLRTIYRDMDVLMGSGVPVEGRRGHGYRLTAPITLPPLNLSLTELEALQVGLAVTGEAADPELQAAARSLSAKIDAVLPEETGQAPRGYGFATYPFAEAAAGYRHLARLRAAIRARQKLKLGYEVAEGRIEDRVIRPLHLDYWGRVWTVTAWCETQGDFAQLRAERIETLRVLPQLFVEEKGKRLRDFRDRQEGA